MVRILTHRSPTHPGEMLLEEFLRPIGLTQRELAAKLHVPYQRTNELVRGRRGVRPGTPFFDNVHYSQPYYWLNQRLAKFFGTSAAFWLNLQLRWDLYHAQRSEAEELKKIWQYSLTRRPAESVAVGRISPA